MFFASLKKIIVEVGFLFLIHGFDPVFLFYVSKTGVFPHKYNTFFKIVTVWCSIEMRNSN